MTSQWRYKLAVQAEPGLSPGAVALGKEIGDAAGPALKWDVPTQGELARRMHRSRSSVVRWWRELREAGLLSYRLEAFRVRGQWRRRIAGLELWWRSKHCATLSQQKEDHMDSFSQPHGGWRSQPPPTSHQHEDELVEDEHGWRDASGCLI